MLISVLSWKAIARRFNNNNDESFGDHGFSKQEFDGEELVDVGGR